MIVNSHTLEKALNLWVELSGVDPNTSSFTLGEYDVRKMHQAIREALELDHTQATACLLLDYFATQYFGECSVSVMELLENPEDAAAYVRQASELLALIRTPELKAIGEEFALKMRTAVRQYQADTPEVLSMIEDQHELAILRRDALRSIENLQVNQFLRGDTEPETTQPQYNPEVFQFWNVNSLLNAACRMPAGVSLCLIRDPDEFQSYFAFAIRNGGNLFLLSDIEKNAHPLQRYMSRRPDRALERRVARNWFPYNLLDIKVDEENERLYVDQKAQAGVVPYQQESFPLKALRELAPQTVIWTVMMFDLILERYFFAKYQHPELSYTGEMIRCQDPLLKQAKAANLPVPAYEPLGVSALTVEELKSENVDAEQIGHDGGSPLSWMEDRYAGQVDQSVLNLLDCGGNTHYISTDTGKALTETKSEYEKNHPFWRFDSREHFYLNSMPATAFGTKAQLLADRAFLGRHNLAEGVNRQARIEYELRKDEIAGWYKKAIEKNLSLLLDMACNEEVWVGLPDEYCKVTLNGIPFIRSELQRPAGRSGSTVAGYQLMKRWTEKEIRDSGSSYADCYTGGMSRYGVRLNQGFLRNRYHCFVTGAVATYRVVWRPQTPADLALLAGCDVSELPDILQHWLKETDHRGNAILNRIDPMAWVLKNPWENHSFNVVMSLSIRALNKAKKVSSGRWQERPEKDVGCQAIIRFGR